MTSCCSCKPHLKTPCSTYATLLHCHWLNPTKAVNSTHSTAPRCAPLTPCASVCLHRPKPHTPKLPHTLHCYPGYHKPPSPNNMQPVHVHKPCKKCLSATSSPHYAPLSHRKGNPACCCCCGGGLSASCCSRRLAQLQCSCRHACMRAPPCIPCVCLQLQQRRSHLPKPTASTHPSLLLSFPFRTLPPVCPRRCQSGSPLPPSPRPRPPPCRPPRLSPPVLSGAWPTACALRWTLPGECC